MTTPTHYIGTHDYSFRRGQQAEIVEHLPEGAKRSGVTGRWLPRRALFRLRWPDGVEDYAAVGDTSNYHLIYAK